MTNELQPNTHPEFGSYDIDWLPDLGPSWRDASDGNDVCPKLQRELKLLKECDSGFDWIDRLAVDCVVWCDWPEADDREFTSSARYRIGLWTSADAGTEHICSICETDNLDVLKTKLKTLFGGACVMSPGEVL